MIKKYKVTRRSGGQVMTSHIGVNYQAGLR